MAMKYTSSCDGIPASSNIAKLFGCTQSEGGCEFIIQSTDKSSHQFIKPAQSSPKHDRIDSGAALASNRTS